MSLVSRADVSTGRWRGCLFLWPLPLVLAALVAGPLSLAWKLVLPALVVLLTVAEWRRQPLPHWLLFSEAGVEIGTRDGRVWQPLQPLHRFQCPLCLAMRCRSGNRVRWLTVYADEVPAPVFARLNRLAQGVDLVDAQPR